MARAKKTRAKKPRVNSNKAGGDPTAPGLVAYRAEVEKHCLTGDFEGLLAYLGKIMRGPNHGHPENGAAPEEGFDSLCARVNLPSLNVQLQKIFTRWWQPPQREDPDLEVHPFNAVRLTLNDGGHMIAASGTFVAEPESFTQRYGLDNELTGTLQPEAGDRDDDDYSAADDRYRWFCHRMLFGNAYSIRYQDTTVPSALIFYDLTIALGGRHLTAVAQALLEDKRFAAIGKSLPFYFLLARHDDVPGVPPARELIALDKIDEAQAQQLKSSHAFMKNVVVPRLLGGEERLQYLLGYIHRSIGKHPELDELWELAASDPSVLTAVLKSARQVSIRGRQFPRLSKRLWALADHYPDELVPFFSELLAAPYEAAEEEDDEYEHDPNFSAPAYDITGFLKGRYELWRTVPEAYRESLRPAYEAGIEPFVGHELPMVRLVAHERMADILFELPGRPDEEPGPDLSGMPDAYVETAVGALSLIKDRLDNARWDGILGRLEYIGHRAAAAVGDVETLLEQILGRQVEAVTPRGRLEILQSIGRLLFRLGATTIPDKIAKAYAKRPSEMWFQYYDAWEKQCATEGGVPAAVASQRSDVPEPGLAALSIHDLTQCAITDPYDVFVECERRFDAGETKGLKEPAQLAAAHIEELLLTPDEPDEIISAYMEFGGYMMESIVIDDEPEEGITQAMEILEQKLGRMVG